MIPLPANLNKFVVALASFIAALSVALASTPEVAPTSSEWLTLALVFFGALGVYAIPNADKPTDAATTVRPPRS